MIAKSHLEKIESVTVYYDGLCHLCSREINHYKKMKGSENISFVDITDPSFKAEQVGLDPVQVHKSLHARDQSGALYTGVDAFICIWKVLPGLHFLAAVASRAPVHSVLEIFYAVFAKVRPLLPRKSCESSPYCETHVK